MGRPCGELPVPLADVAPDLPREIASAVMGCLERVAAVAAEGPHLPGPARGGPAEGPDARARRPRLRPPRRRRGPAAASGRARRAKRASRSHMPLLLATLFVLAAAAVSYLWIQRQGPDAAGPPAARPAARATPGGGRPGGPSPVRLRPDGQRPGDPAGGPARRSSHRAVPAPFVPTRPRAPTPTPTPDAGPDRRRRPLPPRRPCPSPLPRRGPPRTPAVAAAPVEPRSASQEPVVLATLSPPSIRRPGKVLLDLRGTGLRADLRARVLPAARGAARHHRGAAEVGEREPHHRPARARRDRHAGEPTPSCSRTRPANRRSRSSSPSRSSPAAFHSPCTGDPQPRTPFVHRISTGSAPSIHSRPTSGCAADPQAAHRPATGSAQPPVDKRAPRRCRA